jgi:hypothetical protein
MKYITLCAALALLGGCVTAKPITGPDGRQSYSVSCNGGIHDLGDCYNKAAEVCHGPYDVVGGESSTAVFVSGNQYGVYGGGVPKRTIIVACKS